VREYYEGKRVVVTGGAGFVGSHLVDALIRYGSIVTVLDNLHSGVLSNLCDSLKHVHWVNADLRDRDAVVRVLDGSDCIFHLGANASVPFSVEEPWYDFETNVVGTYNVLQALLQGTTQRVLFASSAAVYGVPSRTPVDELHPLEPVSPYGGSKLAAERLGISYSRAFGVQFVVARLFNTYGPRQRKYVMYDLLCKLKMNPTHLEVLGDGCQVRDYSFVADTVSAMLLLMRDGSPGSAYNIGGGHPIQIRDLVPLLAKVMGVDGRLSVTYTGVSWRGDIPVMCADISRLRALGYMPQTGLYEGIVALRDWLEREVWHSGKCVYRMVSARA